MVAAVAKGKPRPRDVREEGRAGWPGTHLELTEGIGAWQPRSTESRLGLNFANMAVRFPPKCRRDRSWHVFPAASVRWPKFPGRLRDDAAVICGSKMRGLDPDTITLAPGADKKSGALARRLRVSVHCDAPFERLCAANAALYYK